MALFRCIEHWFVLLSVALPFVGSAQNKADSLLHVLKTNGPSAEVYNDLIWAYVFNQPDSAIFFGHRGTAWCKKHNDNALLGPIHNRIGVAYDIKSMSDSALFHYNKAMEEAEKVGNEKTKASALNNIGLVYWNLGEPDKAIDHYIRSARIFERIDNRIGLGNNYNNIALILYEDGQLDKSRNYNLQALKIRQQINHEYGIAASYSNLAQLYSTEGMMKIDSALYYLWLAIPIKKKLDDRFGLARSYHNLGDLYLGLGTLDSSLTYQLLALDLQLQLENVEGYASTYYNISGVFEKMKDRLKQMAYLDTAEYHAQNNNDQALLWKIYLTKAKALGISGEYQRANDYWLRYVSLKDSIVTLERSKQVQELETRFRTSEKDRALAEQNEALVRSQLELENRNKWIAGLIGGLLSLILLAYALIQTNKRKAQAEKDSAIILERERGLQAIIQATEDERKRIAKDLHDGIVQSLTGLSLRLQKLFQSLTVDSEQQSKLSESQTILDESIAEVRSISHQMMPRVLSETGLIPAIEDMLAKSLSHTEIDYSFEHHQVENQRFEENIEVSLYRICQELINNIIKHSGAKAVSVQLLKTRSHLVLVVEDNGKGFKFDDPNNRNGIGLMNITSRAKAMKGEVDYQPSPQQGTVATIRIPLS